MGVFFCSLISSKARLKKRAYGKDGHGYKGAISYLIILDQSRAQARQISRVSGSEIVICSGSAVLESPGALLKSPTRRRVFNMNFMESCGGAEETGEKETATVVATRAPRGSS